MSDEELTVEIENSLARTYGPEVTKTFGALLRSPDDRMVDAALRAILDDKMEALGKVELPRLVDGVGSVPILSASNKTSPYPCDASSQNQSES